MDLVRQPRDIVMVNGTIFVTESWEVDSNTHYTPDTFRVSLPLSGQKPGFDSAWWSVQAKLEVKIYQGFPANPQSFSADDLTLIFSGRTDDYVFKPAARHIEVSGRDRTGELIDTKTTAKYTNLTSSQIATKIAQAHGLTVSVTATETKAGRFYTQDFVRLQDDRTEWDLLTWLAKEEGFDCYVRGDTLYFNPKAPATNPYQFVWTPPEPDVPSFDGTDLEFTHNFSLAKDIVVVVRSHDPKRGKSFTKTAKATHTKSKALKGATAPVYDVQTYTYTFANLDPEGAQKRANEILLNLTQHEVKCSIEGPANNDFQAGQPLEISGTETAYDQIYYADSILRSMGPDGYRWTINAKNHPVESEPDL